MSKDCQRQRIEISKDAIFTENRVILRLRECNTSKKRLWTNEDNNGEHAFGMLLRNSKLSSNANISY